MPGESLKQYLQARRKAISAAILIAGTAAGLFLYLTAPLPDDAARQEMEASKEYQRQLEMYGGTANVLALEIREWFDGLWHGPTLGITVVCLSALLALVVYLALIPLPPLPDGSREGPGEGKEHEP